MAGNRRAELVSIAMGPGLYSNTTGRGAHTRINYQNFDRWKDGSWVRWHKLLPEKQGGWAYQSLTGAQGNQLVPGSPTLLVNVAGNSTDTSVLDNTTLLGGGTLAAPTLFGSNGVNNGGRNYLYSYCLLAPFASGSALDVLGNGISYTVECFVQPINGYIPGNVGAASVIFTLNDKGDTTTTNKLEVYLTSNGATNATINVSYLTSAGAYTTTGIAVTGLNDGTWHHVAMVNNAGTYSLYVDGVRVLPTFTPWSGYKNNTTPGYAHAFGSDSAYSSPFTNYALALSQIRITGLAVYTTNFTPPSAAGKIGLPNALGTATPPNAFLPTVYQGVCRDLHDWSSIDGQYWIALGTHLKLYLVNQATLYDITPDRKTSNVTNAITTTATSQVVTIVDTGHQANTGDFVDISGASAVGGVTLAGDYEISVLDPNTYTVQASTAATSGATGGGNFSIAYEISAGLPANGQLLGYGTGEYGEGTYGTPRAAGTGVFARMRTWSLDNYGQDLVASQSDGEIYYWTKSMGPNSPAMLIPLAPTGCQRVIVDAQQRVIIALGCTDETSAYDAMLVRWCSFDNVTDWVETDVNTAGSELLTSGSRLITGLKTKGQNLLFTDTTIYRMQFVGGTDIYDFYPAGGVTIVGPNAAIDVDGVAYFMGFDNFYNYSGTLNLQSCDVWETVFDPNVPTSLLRSQSEGVVCYTYEPKTEITWLYPSIGGVQTVTFTAGIAQGATSATLAAAWTGTTGIYTLQFSDQESQFVTLTQGQTTALWSLPLTAAVSATATSIGNDRYVTYNWEDGTWYYGAWTRTCAMGRSPALGGYPYGANAGFLYQHEVGTDAVEASGTTAIGWYMQSLDITIGGAKSEYTMGGSDARFTVGGSDAHLLVRSLVPDWAYLTGTMNVTLLTKDRPQDTPYVIDGPVAFTSATDQIDIDAHGSQLVIQFDNYTGVNGAPSLGSSFRMGILQGLATPYAKR